MRDESPLPITPIANINPYSQRWVIQARVTKKSEMKSWSNAKGAGNLFSIDLIDDRGTEIRATFFKETAEKFFPVIEERKVYTFSTGKIKSIDPKNARFSTIKNNYEISFDSNTDIKPVVDDGKIKAPPYNFVKIAEVASRDIDSTIDLIAVVKTVFPSSEFTSKAGKLLVKRDLIVFDDSNTEIRLTLWGEAAKFDCSVYHERIVAFRGLKIGEFQGRTLSAGFNGSIALEPPDLDEGRALHMWNETSRREGRAPMATLSASSEKAERDPEPLEQRKTISSVHEEGVGLSEKGDYLSTKATFNFFKHDGNPWYSSCTTPDCKKKVTETNGGFECMKCNKEIVQPLLRFVLSARVADHTGESYVSLFDDTARIVLGATAEEIHQMRLEGNAEAADGVFSRACFKQYTMRCKAKMEQVQDAMRLKVSLLKVVSVESQFASECQQMLDAIAKYP